MFLAFDRGERWACVGWNTAEAPGEEVDPNCAPYRARIGPSDETDDPGLFQTSKTGRLDARARPTVKPVKILVPITGFTLVWRNRSDLLHLRSRTLGSRRRSLSFLGHETCDVPPNRVDTHTHRVLRRAVEEEHAT